MSAELVGSGKQTGSRTKPRLGLESLKKRFGSSAAKNQKQEEFLAASWGDIEKRMEAKLEASLGLSDSAVPQAEVPEITPEKKPKAKKNNSANQGGAKKKPANAGQKAAGKKAANAAKAKETEPAPQKNNAKNTANNTNKTKNSAAAENKKAAPKAKKTPASAPKAAPKNNKSKSLNGEGLSVIPLGGLGEVGKNMTLIRYGNSMIVIDAGMTFPDEDLPGIDLVIPDYNYLLENRKIVEGVFLTHGHEDHIGALPYVLRDLPMPVYGGKLTLGLLQNKLKEKGITGIELNEVKNRDVIKAGPFKVEFIRVSHSIPDSFAIAIHTPVGIVLHTGDIKLDMTPIDGEVMDMARLAALGEKGVLLLMADSTNAEVPGFTASEKTVGHNLESLFFTAKDRIIVTTFASNVHRLQQAIWTAEETGRKVAVVGRGMNNVISIATELGYLQVKPGTFIDVGQVNHMPDNEVMILTTGSQGESLAGLTRMSLDEHRQIRIRPSDVVIISANAIPGNEKAVAKTVDSLYRHGAKVVHGRSWGVHVSGHASAEDLKLIFNMVRPKFFMPVHGEYRMLCAHRELAESVGIDGRNIFIMENGDVLELNKKTAKITGRVHSGRLLIDGLGVGDVGAAVLKDRKQLADDGIVMVNVVIDLAEGKPVADPFIISRGFVYEKDNGDIFKEADGRIMRVIEDFQGDEYNMPALKGAIRSNLGKFFFDQTGRRPIILPVIMEVNTK